jgi:MFS family permease
VLRSRPYGLLLSAQVASLLGDFFNYVAVAWLVLELTGSNLAVGAVLAAASVPRAVLMLLGGAVSDRFSPRTSMFVGGLARALIMAVLAGLALTHTVQRRDSDQCAYAGPARRARSRRARGQVLARVRRGRQG